MKIRDCKYYTNVNNVIKHFIDNDHLIPRSVMEYINKATDNGIQFDILNSTHRDKLISIFSDSMKLANKQVRDAHIAQGALKFKVKNPSNFSQEFYNKNHQSLIDSAKKFYHVHDSPNRPLEIGEAGSIHTGRGGGFESEFVEGSKTDVINVFATFNNPDDRINYILESTRFYDLFQGHSTKHGLTTNLDGVSSLDVKMLHLTKRALQSPVFKDAFEKRLLQQQERNTQELADFIRENNVSTENAAQLWKEHYSLLTIKDQFIENGFYLSDEFLPLGEGALIKHLGIQKNQIEVYNKEVQEAMFVSMMQIKGTEDYHRILGRQITVNPNEGTIIGQDTFPTSMGGYDGKKYKRNLLQAQEISLEDVLNYKFLETQNPGALNMVHNYQNMGESSKRLVTDLLEKETGQNYSALRASDQGVNPSVLGHYFKKVAVRKKLSDMLKAYPEYSRLKKENVKNLTPKELSIVRTIQKLETDGELSEYGEHLDIIFNPDYAKLYEGAKLQLSRNRFANPKDKVTAEKTVKRLEPYMGLRHILLSEFNRQVSADEAVQAGKRAIQSPVLNIQDLKEQLQELHQESIQNVQQGIEQRLTAGEIDIAPNQQTINQLVLTETEKNLGKFLTENKESLGMLIHYGKRIPVEKLTNADNYVQVTDAVKGVLARSLQEVVSPEKGLILWGKQKELAQKLAHLPEAKEAIRLVGEAHAKRKEQVNTFTGLARNYAITKRENAIKKNDLVITLNKKMLVPVTAFKNRLKALVKEYTPKPDSFESIIKGNLKTEDYMFKASVKPILEQRLTQLLQEKRLWRASLSDIQRQILSGKGYKDKKLSYGKDLEDEIKIVEDALKGGNPRLAISKMIQSLSAREKRMTDLIANAEIKKTNLANAKYNPDDYNDELRRLKKENPNQFTPDFIARKLVKAIQESPEFKDKGYLDEDIAEALTWHVWTDNPLKVQGISAETDFVWHDFTRLDSKKVDKTNPAHSIYTEEFGVVPKYISAKRMRLPVKYASRHHWVAYTPDGKMLMKKINGVKTPYVFDSYDDFSNFANNVKSAINKTLAQEQNTISAAVNLSTPYYGITAKHVSKNGERAAKHFSETNVIDIRMPKDGDIEANLRRAKNSGLTNSHKALVHNDERKVHTMMFNLMFGLGWTPQRLPNSSTVRWKRGNGREIPPKMAKVIKTEGRMSLLPWLQERWVARSSDSFNNFGYSVDNVRRQKNIWEWSEKYMIRNEEGIPRTAPGFKSNAVKMSKNKHGEDVISLRVPSKEQFWLQEQVAGLSGPYFRPRGTLVQKDPTDGHYKAYMTPQAKVRGQGQPTGGAVMQPGVASKKNRAKPFIDTRDHNMIRAIYGEHVHIAPVYGELDWINSHPVLADYRLAVDTAMKKAQLTGTHVNIVAKDDGSINLVLSKTPNTQSDYKAAGKAPLNYMVLKSLKGGNFTFRFSDLPKIYPDQESWLKPSFGKDNDKMLAENDLTIISAKTRNGVITSILNPSGKTDPDAYAKAVNLVNERFNQYSVLDAEALADVEDSVNKSLDVGEYEDAFSKAQDLMNHDYFKHAKAQSLMVETNAPYLRKSFGAVQTFFVPNNQQTEATYNALKELRDADLREVAPNEVEIGKKLDNLETQAKTQIPGEPEDQDEAWEKMSTAVKDFARGLESGAIKTPEDAVNQLLHLGVNGFQYNKNLQKAIKLIRHKQQRTDTMPWETDEATQYLEMLANVPDAQFNALVHTAVGELNLPGLNISDITKVDEEPFDIDSLLPTGRKEQTEIPKGYSDDNVDPADLDQ